MAIVCPQCAALAVKSAEAVDTAGRMLRCARCGTRWLPRVDSNDQVGGQQGHRFLQVPNKFGRPRFERVIEHNEADVTGIAVPGATATAKPSKPAVSPSPPSAWLRMPAATPIFTAWSGAVAVILFVLVGIVAVDSTVVGASPDDGSSRFSGLEVQLLDSTASRIRNGHAVDVSGEIVNPTKGDIDVPAVRLSIHSDGVELHSWIVEPTMTRLAGGSALHFRSRSAAPSSDIDDVSIRLIKRRNMVIGAR